MALTPVAGLGAREVLGVVRDARAAADADASVVVTGVLASELARQLQGEGDRRGAVRVGGDPASASALVVVLGGEPGPAEEHAMRAAARASIPIVAVQTDPAADVKLPYVPAGDVVVCPPGSGFPVAEIVRVLVVRLGPDAVPLAAQVAALREPVAGALIHRASLRAAAVGAFARRREGADFPVLALLQARLVLDLAAVHGRELDADRAPELAAVAGSGLGARALVRRLPRRLPLVGALAAFLTTRGIGKAAHARFARSG